MIINNEYIIINYFIYLIIYSSFSFNWYYFVTEVGIAESSCVFGSEKGLSAYGSMKLK
jgi:hypothetical protein